MKKWIWMVPFYAGALLLQPFLYHLLPDLGQHMHLVLTLSTVLLFLYEDSVAGLIFGSAFCLLQDCFFGMYAGPGAVSVICVGLLVMLARQLINRENYLNMLLMLAAATWVYASVYWCVYAALGSPYSYLYAMKSLPGQLGWNCAVGMILYTVWRRRVIRHRRDRYFQ